MNDSLGDPVDFVTERLGFVPDAKQELLLRGRMRRCLLNCSRQWGKSTITAAKAVHRAYTVPGSLVVVLGPSARQSAEFLRKAAGFTRRLGIRPRGDGDNEISLQFPRESRIVGLPGKEDTVRGFSAVSLLLIDEAARVSDDLYNAVSPMLAVGDGDLWLMSTPFGQRGFFYEEWAHGGEMWERLCVPASECARIPPSFLEERRKAMGERWYRQEFCCEFTDTEGSLFESELIRKAINYAVAAK
ncbi:MAG: terminase family protein [Bryobacteraceae bacterium]